MAKDKEGNYPPKARMKYYGHIQQKEIRRLGKKSDCEEFRKPYGHTIVGDRECFTNYKAYIQQPTLRHPLNIKHAMNNPAGDAFCQFPTIEEFDQMLSELTDWRMRNNEIIEWLIHEENILKGRRHILKIIENILEDTDNPLPRIMIDDEIINDRYENDMTDKAFDIIDRLLTAVNGRQLKILREELYSIYQQVNDKTRIMDYMKLRVGHMNLNFEEKDEPKGS